MTNVTKGTHVIQTVEIKAELGIKEGRTRIEVSPWDLQVQLTLVRSAALN